MYINEIVSDPYHDSYIIIKTNDKRIELKEKSPICLLKII